MRTYDHRADTSPARLWHIADAETDSPEARSKRYAQLMREHGHIVDKTCGHKGRCACQNLPCGYPGFLTNETETTTRR